jgi:hypothetical protein
MIMHGDTAMIWGHLAFVRCVERPLTKNTYVGLENFHILDRPAIAKTACQRMLAQAPRGSLEHGNPGNLLVDSTVSRPGFNGITVLQSATMPMEQVVYRARVISVSLRGTST